MNTFISKFEADRSKIEPSEIFPILTSLAQQRGDVNLGTCTFSIIFAAYTVYMYNLYIYVEYTVYTRELAA